MPVVSFTVAGVHPHDLGTALDFAGIAVRSGHHCAQPLLAPLGVSATVRVSLGLYNTAAELETLATEPAALSDPVSTLIATAERPRSLTSAAWPRLCCGGADAKSHPLCSVSARHLGAQRLPRRMAWAAARSLLTGARATRCAAIRSRCDCKW